MIKIRDMLNNVVQEFLDIKNDLSYTFHVKYYILKEHKLPNVFLFDTVSSMHGIKQENIRFAVFRYFMRILAVIPARYTSSRFPGKLLSDIQGKSILQLVYEQALACPGIDKVIIATDDDRIMNVANSFGAVAVKTSSACRSGTDRVAEAISGIDADAIINIQGDQVILDTKVIKGMLDALESGTPMVTIATPITHEDAQDSNTVKVVVNVQGYALYFSRALIPFPRSKGLTTLLRHVGLYGFSRETLFKFTGLPQSPLELTESLEQLRALENGIPIKVVLAEGKFFEINTPEDRQRLIQQWQP